MTSTVIVLKLLVFYPFWNVLKTLENAHIYDLLIRFISINDSIERFRITLNDIQLWDMHSNHMQKCLFKRKLILQILY